ncbi:MAG: hypothetical protein EOO27_21840 [Comamonadaceae bacterium]|nr:MAG: hypothetical protein EOO27_21840 [Comamonadaceae bacterium]
MRLMIVEDDALLGEGIAQQGIVFDDHQAHGESAEGRANGGPAACRQGKTGPFCATIRSGSGCATAAPATAFTLR